MTLDELDEAWQVLSLTEKTVLKARFGLNGHKPKTFRQIGKELGVSSQRVLQHQGSAFSKLRRAGHQLEKNDQIVFTPKAPRKPPQPKKKPKPRKKPKVVPKPKPPQRTDAERLDWLERWIWGSAMQIRKDYEGGLSMYRGNQIQLSADSLRELLDLVLFENVSPDNK